MILEDKKKRVLTDPNFVALQSCDFSLEKLVEKYPEGAPDKVIAAALMIEEREVEELYQAAVEKLQQLML